MEASPPTGETACRRTPRYEARPRLSVSSGEERAKVELGVDWRKNEPILLAIGPVLHADDAAANKVCALFGRAEVHDYVDVAAILASGRYSEEGLVRLAEEHDPGPNIPTSAAAAPSPSAGSGWCPRRSG
jgi:hypothetical protein